MRGTGVLNIALVAKRIWNVSYVYDSHEMMPFRARKNGLFRMTCEAVLERMVIAFADRNYVVNRPIQRFYRHFYGSNHISVRPNNFYLPNVLTTRSDGPRLLLYIGTSNEHRGLGALRDLAKVSNTLLIMVLPACDLGLESGVTKIALAEYPEILPSLLEGTMPYMWCCFSSNILSYRYSLPNKFFQALAFGMPIIAGKGTYLAAIIDKYDIGFVFVDGAVSQMWNTSNYERMTRNVIGLKKAIESGSVTV